MESQKLQNGSRRSHADHKMVSWLRGCFWEHFWSTRQSQSCDFLHQSIHKSILNRVDSHFKVVVANLECTNDCQSTISWVLWFTLNHPNASKDSRALVFLASIHKPLKRWDLGFDLPVIRDSLPSLNYGSWSTQHANKVLSLLIP